MRKNTLNEVRDDHVARKLSQFRIKRGISFFTHVDTLAFLHKNKGPEKILELVQSDSIKRTQFFSTVNN